MPQDPPVAMIPSCFSLVIIWSHTLSELTFSCKVDLLSKCVPDAVLVSSLPACQNWAHRGNKVSVHHKPLWVTCAVYCIHTSTHYTCSYIHTHTCVYASLIWTHSPRAPPAGWPGAGPPVWGTPAQGDSQAPSAGEQPSTGPAYHLRQAAIISIYSLCLIYTHQHTRQSSRELALSHVFAYIAVHKEKTTQRQTHPGNVGTAMYDNTRVDRVDRASRGQTALI